MLLDPLVQLSPRLEESFKSWLLYYKTRKDHKPHKWNEDTIEENTRPMQSDGYNWSIFVINYIKSYCLHGTLTFPFSEINLMSDRQSFAETIKDYALKNAKE